MKTIGLLGGLSWHSSLEYYRIINQEVQARLGGAHSARCLLVSLDYAEVDALERQDRWDDTAAIVIAAAQSLERGGADFVVICSNTTHKLADHVQAAIGIPILHIADATGRAIRDRGLERVGLLGTRFTMEEDFVRGRLARDHGLEVIIPPEPDRALVHSVIYDELCAGVFRETRAAAISPSCAGWSRQGRRASSWAAPRLVCWFPRTSAPRQHSTRPGCTRWPRWRPRWRNRLRPGLIRG